MTPKEEAKRLVDKFRLKVLQREFNVVEVMIIPLAEECALICVDETIEALEHHTWQNKDWIGFYQEVKQEIETKIYGR